MVVFRVLARLFMLLGLLTGLATVAIVALVLLAVLGGGEVKSCRVAGGGETTLVTRTDERAAAFQSKWDAFQAALHLGGSPAVSFSNDEVSSRASSFLRDRTDAVKDLAICFEPGKAEGSVTFKGLGASISTRFAGDINFSGEHPKVHITSLKAGALPSVGPLREALTGLIDEQLADLQLDYRYQVSFDYDRATITVLR